MDNKLVSAVKSLGSDKALADLYTQRIIELVRNRYTLDDEIALQRQRDTKPEEFGEYFSYVEACKTQAHEEIYEEDSEV